MRIITVASRVLSVLTLTIAVAAKGAPGEIREEMAPEGGAKPFLVSLGGEVAFAGDSLRPKGAALPGFGLRGFVGSRWNVGVPLIVGFEIGLTTWNVNHGGDWSNTHTVGMGLLPTISYAFTETKFLWGKPYVGFSIGPFLSWVRTDGSGPRTTSSLSISVETLLRPGLSFSLGRALDLQIETAVGIAAGAPLVAPQIKFLIPLHAGHNQIHTAAL